MRCFTALHLHEDVLRKLDRLQKEMKSVIPRGVRWTQESNWHITLHFLGDVPKEDHDLLYSTLEEGISGHAPFSLTLDAPGFFGSKQKPQVLWVGLQKEPALLALHASCQSVLQRDNFRTEERRYNPHITLGYVKQAHHAAAPFQEHVDVWSIPSVSQLFSEVVLIRSTLRPQGAKYDIVKRFPLGG